jgi:hypothetical protein
MIGTGSNLVYQRSSVQRDGSTYFLARSEIGNSKLLGVEGDTDGFEKAQSARAGVTLFPLTATNSATLRSRLSWLRPVPLSLRTSAGFGDRLGLATPGHVRAMREVPDAAGCIAPIFAQQSVRENSRTGRTPQQVLDDAMWGLFQEGWNGAWGADADHLKTPADLEAFVDAGYTFYTVDPGDCVDDTAQVAPAAEVEAKVRALPWDTLEDSQQDLERRYLDASLPGKGGGAKLEREKLLRAAAKYGHAVGQSLTMYRHLTGLIGERQFDFEVSVDETESTTSLTEHFYIASELHRLGVRWISLAPRFVGRFEKGVDYIGDLNTFAAEFAHHAAIAKELGPYKLSLHSGSDKFSIYALAARLTTDVSAEDSGGFVHLKTAGTSYLEALRTVARVNPPLFREILGFSRDRYEVERATYHVSAQLARVAGPDTLSEGALAGLLDQFDARQVLHVTYGSVLDNFGGRLDATLREYEEDHYALLQSHFVRHLRPFVE